MTREEELKKYAFDFCIQARKDFVASARIRKLHGVAAGMSAAEVEKKSDNYVAAKLRNECDRVGSPLYHVPGADLAVADALSKK